MEIEQKKGTYSEFKTALDTEMNKAAESFVKIGYLLKIARDTDILAESGYNSLTEFAQAEYNLDKSQVSRFIAINDNYSVDGYSDRLMTEYTGYGYSKLAMMLTLPAAVVAELTPSYSKSDIQVLKEEVAAEEAISPMEVYLEGEKEELEDASLLYQAMYQLFLENPELYEKPDADIDTLMETLAPAGENIYTVRIQGVGRIMVSCKEDRVNLVNIRTNNVEICTWEQVTEEYTKLFGSCTWEERYGRPYPVKSEPAAEESVPVETVKEKKPKKPKVTKAKVTSEPVITRCEAKSDEASHEPIEGQDTIDEHPEYLPEQTASEDDNMAAEDDETETQAPDEENELLLELEERRTKVSRTAKSIAEYLDDYKGQRVPERALLSCIDDAERLVKNLQILKVKWDEVSISGSEEG
jgi:hypothetical protein|nr:MAG TPA: hypothetical protein [Caudoviricetes sp.]